MRGFIRRILAVLAVLICFVCVLPSVAAATSVTKEQAVAWAQSKKTIGLDYDGLYGNQCVDLIYYYYEYLGVSCVGGNASAYISNTLPSGWQRITMTSGFVPQPGDIGVWKTNYSGTCGSGAYTTGPNGHIGIITAADTVGFMAVNQNFFQTPYCIENWFYLDGLQCVIRPNFVSSVSVTKTLTCDYRVTIPANYKLDLYYGAADASPTSERWINGKDAAYTLKCDRQVTLSNGSVRYRFTSSDGYTVYFAYNSSKMSLKTNHSLKTVSSVAATCVQAGSKMQKCSSCGYTETTTVAATGHKYNWTYTIDEEATCTTAGSRSRHCYFCSAKKYKIELPATGHTLYETVNKEPTCTATGTKKVLCRNCEYSATEGISALGHKYQTEWTVDKAATCTVAGSKSHHCERCSEKSDVTTVPAKNHFWGEWTVTKKATTTAEGVLTRKCKSCDAAETQTIMKLASDGHEHQMVEWKTVKEADCESSGTAERSCKICGGKEFKAISAEGHSFGEWSIKSVPTEKAEGVLERKCKACGSTEQEKISRLISTEKVTTSAESPVSSAANDTPVENKVISSQETSGEEALSMTTDDYSADSGKPALSTESMVKVLLLAAAAVVGIIAAIVYFVKIKLWRKR